MATIKLRGTNTIAGKNLVHDTVDAGGPPLKPGGDPSDTTAITGQPWSQ